MLSSAWRSRLLRSLSRGALAGATVPIGLLLVAGCTVSGGSTAHPAGDTSPDPSAQPDATTRDDLTHEWVTPWSRYEQLSAHRLRFFYTSGDPDCYGVRTAARETDTTIEVATIVGTKPDATERCTLVASLSSVIITTVQPIGTRTVTHLANPTLHP